MTKKVLNLYAGIGGNRKLWEDVEVTAIERNKTIAEIYQYFFPKDTIIVTDAHKYILEHYDDGFDFIWSSPPCPSHSRLRKTMSIYNNAKPIYPDMRLYEEIIFLQNHSKCKWVIENVISYYDPLIWPQKVNRHYFWANFIISNKRIKTGKLDLSGEKEDKLIDDIIKQLENEFGFDLSKYKLTKFDKRTILRNCVHPKLGKHILDCAFKNIQTQLPMTTTTSESDRGAE